MANTTQYDSIFKDAQASLRSVRSYDSAQKKSIDWLVDVTTRMRFVSATPTRIMKSDTAKLVPANQLVTGRMYFMFYDPKFKDTLPWYDTFPLIFPFAFRKDGKGIIGINLHYLFPRDRIVMMQALLPYKEGAGMKARLDWNYGVLKAVASNDVTKHVVKDYLFSHMRSPFMQIPLSDWGTAALLPVERFKKKSARTVWSQI